MSPKRYSRECDWCGKQYEGWGAHYCSRECSAEAKKKHGTRDCQTCGKTIELSAQQPDKKFCSRPCYYEDLADRKEADTRACEGCGEPFEVTWRNREAKYCSQGCYKRDVAPDPTPKPDTESDLLDYSYAPGTDGEEGTYYFPVDGRIYPIPESTWESICRDYSEMGGDMTQKEVAREVGISYPVLKRILRQAGQFKASLPFSRERIAEEDEDTLVEEALETKERKIVRKLQRKERKKLEREHREMKKRLMDEERHAEAARRVAERMGEIETPALLLDEPARWRAALAMTTDEHLGLPVWGEGSWGENYDTDIAARRLVGHGRHGAAWLKQQGGAETVYRAYGGDLFNSIFGATTHDTPMDQDTRDEKVWDLALEAVLKNTQAWRQVCDRLVVLFVSGNHDGPKVYQFASTIRFALEGADDVEVRATPKKYDAVRVGDSLHVFDHGAQLTKLSGYKAKLNIETVARKVGGEEYHGADHIFAHLGHKHDRMVVTVGDHLEVIRHPALCESSEYEHEHRWVARPCADIILLDERGRIDTPKRLYRDALDGERQPA